MNEQEKRDRALEELRQAISGSGRKRRRDTLVELLSYRIGSLIEQAGGDMDMGLVLLSEYLNGVQAEVVETSIDRVILSGLRRAFCDLVKQADSTEDATSMFSAYVTHIVEKASELSGYPLEREGEQ